jgi:hypothetical protein
MKRIGVVLGILLVALASAPAQVTVEVVLEEEQFLPGEAIPAAVRITNRSGQTLRLGTEPDWLTFGIESRDGFIVIKSDEVPVLGEFLLESSERATKRVDLAPHFNVTRPGRYSIVAVVRIHDWDQLITAKPRSFDIIDGTKMWEREFGVPRTAGEAPEVRKYTLQQANYLRSQLRLYLRLTDGSGTRVFKVFPIGPMVSFGRPEPQVDKHSNLHVLYQTGPQSFSYTVINPDGDVIVRQTHDYYVQSRPRLQSDPEGKFMVVGGMRRITASDIPPFKPAETNDAPAPPS